ncbi:hypothetical protein [Novosphingobium percolationis]|uniref:hypothetical protein n=1 Tax=Novosphingobium percolationis TaxID=2871811 RepID=UPI001CD33B5F|nr:hypothetical protein [Novosphingobium percolationis]
MSVPTTMRVFIPLTIRKRNGRPKIVPPTDIVPDIGGVDAHVLKAIAKAWGWRRKLESGAAATIQDITDAEGISDRYVGRLLRLAYLAPAVPDRLLIASVPPAVAIRDLAMAAKLPWEHQKDKIFNDTKHAPS